MPKVRKQDIIQKGPLTKLAFFPSPLPTTPQIMESMLYLDGSELSSYFKGRFEALYASCEELRPLMDVVALAGLGQHSAKNKYPGKNKKFKIICLPDSATLDGITQHTGWNTEAHGIYPANKNSVFIWNPEKNKSAEHMSEMFGSTMHELAHFVMQEIFNNSCRPFKQDDEPARRKMDLAIQRARDGIPNMRSYATFFEEGGELYKQFFHAYESIASIFNSGSVYEKNALFPEELIAKIPEIIGTIGTMGRRWFRTSEGPRELYEFFLHYVNPHIIAYLKDHHAERYLAADPSSYDAFLASLPSLPNHLAQF